MTDQTRGSAVGGTDIHHRFTVPHSALVGSALGGRTNSPTHAPCVRGRTRNRREITRDMPAASTSWPVRCSAVLSADAEAAERAALSAHHRLRSRLCDCTARQQQPSGEASAWALIFSTCLPVVDPAAARLLYLPAVSVEMAMCC